MRVAYYSNTLGELEFNPAPVAYETIENVGLNLGNLAFANAGHRLFNEEAFAFDARTDPRVLQEGADILVFCVANWLNEGIDLGWLADRVEQVGLPVVVMGLGAQAGLDGAFPEISEGSRRFLRACSKRTPQILVRGSFTADLCRSLGIENVIPAGCPSILTEAEPRLGKLLLERWELATNRLAFHALEIHDRLRPTEQHLLRLARDNEGSAMILQHQYEMLDLILTSGRCLNDEETQRLKWMCKFLAPEDDEAHVLRWLARHLFYFDSVDAWRRFLRNFSGSINTRIHGTVMCISSGRPAVCLFHDSRTKELAEAMEIPSLDHRDVATARLSPREIFDAVRIDADRFDENRTRLARVYAEVLTEAGLGASEHLRSLAA